MKQKIKTHTDFTVNKTVRVKLYTNEKYKKNKKNTK